MFLPSPVEFFQSHRPRSIAVVENLGTGSLLLEDSAMGLDKVCAQQAADGDQVVQVRSDQLWGRGGLPSVVLRGLSSERVRAVGKARGGRVGKSQEKLPQRSGDTRHTFNDRPGDSSGDLINRGARTWQENVVLGFLFLFSLLW